MDYYELPPPIWRSLSRQGGRYSKRGVHKLRNAPSLIRDAQRLCWRRAEGFMGAAEIVVRDVQRHRRNVIIKLLGKAVG